MTKMQKERVLMYLSDQRAKLFEHMRASIRSAHSSANKNEAVSDELKSYASGLDALLAEMDDAIGAVLNVPVTDT